MKDNLTEKQWSKFKMALGAYINYAQHLSNNQVNEKTKEDCASVALDIGNILNEIKNNNVPKSFIEYLERLQELLIKDSKRIIKDN